MIVEEVRKIANQMENDEGSDDRLSQILPDLCCQSQRRGKAGQRKKIRTLQKTTPEVVYYLPAGLVFSNSLSCSATILACSVFFSRCKVSNSSA